jgi:hypothetical protein
MMQMFVNLSAEVITQGVSKIHEGFSKFFYSESFEETLEKKDSPLAALHDGIQKENYHNSESMCPSHGRTFEIGN